MRSGNLCNTTASSCERGRKTPNVFFLKQTPSNLVYRYEVANKTVATDATVYYYRPGTTGWSTNFGGRPTANRIRRGLDAIRTIGTLERINNRTAADFWERRK